MKEAQAFSFQWRALFVDLEVLRILVPLTACFVKDAPFSEITLTGYQLSGLFSLLCFNFFELLPEKDFGRCDCLTAILSSRLDLPVTSR